MSLSDGLEALSIFKRLKTSHKRFAREVFNELEPLLGQTYEHYPEFTPHGLKHVQQVLENLDRLLEPIMGELDEVQAFTLLVGTLVHDVGMIPDLLEGDPVDVESTYLQDVRGTHHIRSERFVNEKPLFDRLAPQERQAIGRIAKGHRITPLHIREYTDRTFPIRDLAFLAAALRLADELDTTKNRIGFLDIFLRRESFLSRLKPESQEHWHKHLSLDHWDLSHNGEVITVRGTVRNEIGHRGVELVRESLRRTLREIRSIEFRGTPALPLSQLFELTFVGIASEKYRVEIDNEPVIDFLIDSLYDDQLTGVREVVQNAIDGCSLRGKSSGLYKPEVVVDLRDGKLVVEDNGRGMDLHIIGNYLTVMGRSFYKSQDFKTFIDYADFRPPTIGLYGIGIFSLFLIADAFVVQTRFRTKSPAEESRWLETRFTRSFCPTFEIERPECELDYGTRVTVELTEEAKRLLEPQLYSYLSKWFARPKVDIYVGESKETILRQFPSGRNFGPPSNPDFEMDDSGFHIYSQSTEGVFLGFKVRRIEKEALKRRMRRHMRREVPSLMISIEGVRLDTRPIESRRLARIVNLVAKLLSLGKWRIDLEGLLDFPSGFIVPNLSRTGIVEGEEIVRQAASDLAEAIESIIPKLKSRIFESSEMKEAFWDTVLSRLYSSTVLNYLDVDEAVDYSPMKWNGRESRIRNIRSKAEQKISIKGLLPCYEKGKSASPESNGWIPSIPYHFISSSFLPTLFERGWKLAFPENKHSLVVTADFVSETNLLQILESIPIAKQEEVLSLVYWPKSDFGPRFYYWLRKQIAAGKMKSVVKALERIRKPCGGVGHILAFVSRRNGDSPRIERVKKHAAQRWDKLDRSKLHFILEEKSDAKRLLEEFVESLSEKKTRVYYSFARRMRSLAEDPDLKDMAEEFPDTVKKTLKAASIVLQEENLYPEYFMDEYLYYEL